MIHFLLINASFHWLAVSGLRHTKAAENPFNSKQFRHSALRSDALRDRSVGVDVHETVKHADKQVETNQQGNDGNTQS